MTAERSTYLDFVKGVVILLVVLGHSIQYGNGGEFLGSEAFFGHPLFKFIYTFHMPIFMLISGYLFAFSIERHSLWHLVLGKVKGLLVPIFMFGFFTRIVFVALSMLLSGKMAILDFAETYFSVVFVDWHLWFLWSVFLNALIVMLVHRLNDSLLCYFLIGAALLFVPGNVLLGVYSFMYPFFVIGYLSRKYRFFEKLWFSLSSVTLCSLFLFLLCYWFYDRDTYVYTSGQYVLRENGWHYLWLDAYRFFTGIVGSMFMLCLMRYLHDWLVRRRNAFLRLFTMLGSFSMGIYCFQDLLFSWFNGYIMPNITKPGILSVSLVFLSVTSLSLACTYLVKKQRILNNLFLGGR